MGMVIPAVMLVILAIVVIRSLMGVVAHEDAAAPIALMSDTDTTPATPPGVWGEDVRSFLLPAAPGHIDLEHSEHDADANAS
jgi:hypothetical protein